MKVFIILLGLLATISSAMEVKASEGENVGYSCFKEPSWPKDESSSYLCVFELNTVSPFYDEDKRANTIKGFVKSLSSECEVSDAIEMTDPKATIDHAMFLVVYHVRCS